ncbi:MAG: AraC family ligand binding domain-containing protein [Alistipes inops]
MATLPMHGAAKLSDCGIFLREAVPSLPCEAVEYPHRDDYYLFGVVYGGSCTVCVDFQEYELTGGDVVCVLPGQAHAFLQAENLSASLLGMDALLVGGSDRSVIDEYALAPVPLRVDVRQRHELGALFSLLSDRYAEAGDEFAGGGAPSGRCGRRRCDGGGAAGCPPAAAAEALCRYHASLPEAFAGGVA